MADVAFKEGTASAYDKVTLDSHTFYHTTDDDQVYLGGTLLSGQVKTEMLSDLESFGPFGLTFTATGTYTMLSESFKSKFDHMICIISGTDKYTISQWELVNQNNELILYLTFQLLDTTISSYSGSLPIYIVYYDL